MPNKYLMPTAPTSSSLMGVVSRVTLENVATGKKFTVEVYHGIPLSPDTANMALQQEPVYGVKGNISRGFWRDPVTKALFVDLGQAA